MNAGGVQAGTRRGTRLGLALGMCAALFAACEEGGAKNDLNPNYKEPMVWGFLSRVQFYGSPVGCSTHLEVVDFDGLRMVPVVLLNGSQVEPSFFSAFEYDYDNANPIPTYKKYELEVRHYWGTGFCHLVMPGDFRLTVPSNTYILRQGSTLTAAWHTSRGAQWYWLSIYVDYDYYDTTGAWDTYEFTLDTLVYDTSVAVPPERMFPPFVGQVIEGDAGVLVLSGYGPAVEPGDIGNVRGNAVGFVNAFNEPPERYIYVGAPPVVRRTPEGRAMLERFMALLRSRMPSH